MRQLAGRATSKLLPKGWKLETLQTTAAQTPCRRRPVGTACAGCTGFEERRPDLWTKFRFRYNEYPQLVATGLSLEIKFRISYQPVSMSSAASHQSRGPHLNDNEDQTDELPGVLLRRPTLQYVLLAALGILGIYLSLPLGFDPQTTVEWVDLIINIIILVPIGRVVRALPTNLGDREPAGTINEDDLANRRNPQGDHPAGCRARTDRSSNTDLLGTAQRRSLARRERPGRTRMSNLVPTERNKST
jgi:hypothetical protein